MVTLILLVFVLNYKKKFTNLLNNNNTNFVTDDISSFEVEEVIQTDYKNKLKNSNVKDLIVTIIKTYKDKY